MNFSSGNTFSDNLIANCSELGVYIAKFSCNDNLLYQNTFINNKIDAKDKGTSTDWNNALISNKWSNYTGKDADDDGIGDRPYYILPNGFNNKPIYWDPPVLRIISPSFNELFNGSSPDFNISIDEGVANRTWYALDWGLTNITFSGTSGKIDQTAWSQLSNGIVSIIFYANDSRGFITWDEVTFRVIIIEPNVSISSPID